MKTLNLDSVEIVHDRQKTVRTWKRRVARARAERAAVLWGYISQLFAVAGMLMIFLGACMIDTSDVFKNGAFVMLAGLMVLVITAVIRMATEDMDYGRKSV